MSLGRTGDQIKPVTEALKELKDAMQKGQVTTSKVFPYFEELLRRESARGLDIARVSSQAEQGRFETQLDIGWQNFTKGGGEAGLSYFWRMMQKMGSWWEENGAALGKHFEELMLWVNVVRIAIRDLFNFAVSGEENDLVSIINEWGINIQGIRDEIVKIFENIGKVFTGGDQTFGETILVKIQNFSDSVIKILKNLNEFFIGLSTMMDGYRQWDQASWVQKLTGQAEGQGQILKGIGQMTSAAVAGSWNAGVASKDLLMTNKSNRPDTEYSQTFGGIKNYRVPADQIIPPTTPSSSVPMFSRNENVNTHTIDVNVKVSGDPEQVKLFAANEIADQLKTKVPEIAMNTFGQSMTKSATAAGKY